MTTITTPAYHDISDAWENIPTAPVKDANGNDMTDADGNIIYDYDFINGMSGTFNNAIDKYKGALDDALAAVQSDPSNPQKLANYQAVFANYTALRNLQANVMKSIKDTAMGAIQKF
ncbi:type III secretion system needle complex protein PrgI [Serratia quinivorans]|uniref:type III secretion system needle filament subunit SctF n=1 Tax=Serratia quinivorans TaxID=137545 RepID=UPI00217C660C|nr:type III secretion system needle filament subunit SctF [Serratia quinivorans]CAI1905045.1 type III secretion system needle complex protein PrgI [Serratia quinivorans]